MFLSNKINFRNKRKIFLSDVKNLLRAEEKFYAGQSVVWIEEIRERKKTVLWFYLKTHLVVIVNSSSTIKKKKEKKKLIFLLSKISYIDLSNLLIKCYIFCVQCSKRPNSQKPTTHHFPLIHNLLTLSQKQTL
jgi:hypothetical protein